MATGLGYQQGIFGEPWVKRSLKWFLTSVLVFALIVFPLYKLVTKGWSAFQGGSSASASSDFPINLNSPDIQLDWENPKAELEIREDAFSGLVCIPPGTRFVVYTPGDAVLRFTTKRGERDYFVKDHEADLSHSFPSCIFRIRGKPGKAKVYLSNT